MKKILLIFLLIILGLNIYSEKPPYNISLMGSLNIVAADYHDNISFSLSGSVGKILLPKINFLESSLEAGISTALRTTYMQNSIYVFIPGFFGGTSKWVRTDSITITNSLAFNGYAKLNILTEHKFSPFLGLNFGISAYNSKTISETRESDDLEKSWEQWSFVSKTVSFGDSFSSPNLGLTLGFNYFVNYNLSFTAQYDLSFTVSEAPVFDIISWGVRYWF
ncbi:MAG: hypothetical protein N2555_05745 [Endomicrobia bacterium]|nr:hypothetical protein [Endomicrobiia bacterium]